MLKSIHVVSETNWIQLIPSSNCGWSKIDFLLTHVTKVLKLASKIFSLVKPKRGIISVHNLFHLHPHMLPFFKSHSSESPIFSLNIISKADPLLKKFWKLPGKLPWWSVEFQQSSSDRGKGNKGTENVVAPQFFKNYYRYSFCSKNLMKMHLFGIFLLKYPFLMSFAPSVQNSLHQSWRECSWSLTLT